MLCRNLTNKEWRLARLLSEMLSDSLRSGDKDTMVRVSDVIILFFGPIVRKIKEGNVN